MALHEPSLIPRLSSGAWWSHPRSVRVPRDNRAAPQRATPVDPGEHGLIARKGAEKEIRRLNELLEHRVRQRTAALTAANRELEAFASSVSHDLRAPLRAIDGFTALLLQKHAHELDAEGRHYLDQVRAGTVRMSELIDDLLSLSRVVNSEVQRERFDLSALAKAITEELHKREPNRQVESVITPGLFAEADVHLARVALENLLENAWKYTSKRPTARVELGVTERDGQTVFFVRDDGAGFDMTYADKLFRPFQRVHSATEFEGSGIGLTIVQRIIHCHGGYIWAEGDVERGATFYFTLGTADVSSAM
jgi:light-regulated signal transduction histidine kinase (bacteriophytochrome)